MRVLIASNFYPPYVVGGAELIAAHLASWLTKAGHDVTVVTTCDQGTGSEDCIDGVRVVRYFPPNLWWNFERFAANDRRGRLARARWRLRDYWNGASARYFGDILRQVRPEVVHTHNIKGMSPAIWREARRMRIPIVHTAHDYHLICRSGTMSRQEVDCAQPCRVCKLHSRWHAACASSVSLICSPSQFVGDRHALALRAKGRTLVVPNGLPEDPVVRLPRPPGRPLELLYLGQLRREKGAHLLPAIMAGLPPDARLHVAGAGVLIGELEKVAAGDPRMILHGFVEREAKYGLLDRVDALLFPSMWTENAPVVLVEAFMRGVPAIASAIGAIPEFIEHGVNGLLVEPGDAAGFARAACHIENDIALAANLSRGASKTASRFTIDVMGQRYLALYRSSAEKTGIKK